MLIKIIVILFLSSNLATAFNFLDAIKDNNQLCAPDNQQQCAKDDKKITKTGGHKIERHKAKILIIVNQDAISYQDLEERIKLIALFSGMPYNQEAIANLTPQAEQSLILESLQLQLAKDLKIEVTDKEVDQAIENLAKQNGKTLQSLKDELKENNVNLKTLINRFKAQAVWVKFIRARYSSQIMAEITKQAVENALEVVIENQNKPQYELMEIVMYSHDKNKSAKGDVEKILEQLKVSKGIHFRTMAQQLSQAPSATLGGYVGWQTLDQMGVSTAEIVTKMEVGDIGIVNMTEGCKIIKLNDCRMPGEASFGDTQVSYCQINIPFKEPLSEEAAAMISEQIQVIGQSKTCKTLKEDIQKFNIQVQTVENKPLNELPEVVRHLLQKLGVNHSTEPIRSEGELIIFKLCNRGVKNKTRLPTREQIEESLRQERFGKLATREMNRIRSVAFIKYVPQTNGEM